MMPRHEGREQLTDQRPQEQADKTVDGGGERQIQLRRKAVENRPGNLAARTGVIPGDILRRHNRTQQIRAAFDPVVR